MKWVRVLAVIDLCDGMNVDRLETVDQWCELDMRPDICVTKHNAHLLLQCPMPGSVIVRMGPVCVPCPMRPDISVTKHNAHLLLQCPMPGSVIVRMGPVCVPCPMRPDISVTNHNAHLLLQCPMPGSVIVKMGPVCVLARSHTRQLNLGFDLAWGFSDRKMTWLLYWAGAATVRAERAKERIICLWK